MARADWPELILQPIRIIQVQQLTRLVHFLLKASLGSSETLHLPQLHSQKERYKSCLCGGTFSNSTLLYLKGTYW